MTLSDPINIKLAADVSRIPTMLASESSDWAHLPTNLLDDILNNVTSMYDYLHFSIVCKPWNSVALDRIHRNRYRLPMLLIPSVRNPRDLERNYSLYNLTTNTTHEFHVKSPEIHNRFRGSAHGWLILSEKNYSITLLNPFFGITISLPPIIEPLCLNRFFTPLKAMLTCDPRLNPRDYIVVAIWGLSKKLALFQSGAKTWTHLQGGHSFDDFIVHKGNILALDHNMGLWKVETNLEMSNLVQVVPAQLGRDSIPDYLGHLVRFRMYIVESSRGDLLIIKRSYKRSDLRGHWDTMSFTIYKVLVPGEDYLDEDYEDGDEDEEFQMYSKVETLDKDIMFLGGNKSVCFSGEEFPVYMSNCIYYTMDTELLYRYSDCPSIGYANVGIYNIKDGSFGDHYKPHASVDQQHHQQNLLSAIWIDTPFSSENLHSYQF